MSGPKVKFSLLLTERLARSWAKGGVNDEDFDRSLLPFEIISGLFIEDVKALIVPNAFDHYLPTLGTESVRHLKAIKYVIINRYPEYRVADDGNIILGENLHKDSAYLIQEAIACLVSSGPFVSSLKPAAAILGTMEPSPIFILMFPCRMCSHLKTRSSLP